MPWKENSVMEERLRFVLEYEAGEESMSELCRRHEISRETAYLTLHRYPEPLLLPLREGCHLRPTKRSRAKRIDLLERFAYGRNHFSRTQSLRLPIAPRISPPATSTTPLAVSFLHRSASKSQ
jgi:transposase-like protein